MCASVGIGTTCIELSTNTGRRLTSCCDATAKSRRPFFPKALNSNRDRFSKHGDARWSCAESIGAADPQNRIQVFRHRHRNSCCLRTGSPNPQTAVQFQTPWTSLRPQLANRLGNRAGVGNYSSERPLCQKYPRMHQSPRVDPIKKSGALLLRLSS